MMYQSTKVIELGSCAFRQWRAEHSHCRYIHGYQLKAKLWFGCNELDVRNWAVDFGSLKELKLKLQNLFDHTTTVAADDPEIEIFRDLDRRGIIQLRVMEKGVGIERVAEKVFEVADEYVKGLTGDRCWVERVEVFEHEDNSAIYTPFFNIPTQAEDLQLDFNLQTETTTEEAQKISNETPPSPAPNRGASIGNRTTPGMGNLFGGTSWGS